MILLCLTTTSCTKCPPIKDYLHNTSIPHDVTIMDENHKDFVKNVVHWEANTAPTCLLIDDGEVVGRAGDLEELKELLK